MSMNSTLNKIVIFTAGAAIGSIVTWKIVKTKYERIAQEEIDSVREVYSRKDAVKGVVEETEEEDEPDERSEYEELVKGSGYISSQHNKSKVREMEEDDDMAEPYVISPEEFDENGYDTVSLYYYEENGVVTNSVTNEVIENIDELIGEDSLSHFGEYEDDSVFVRNDNIETDFEILKVREAFSEVD